MTGPLILSRNPRPEDDVTYSGLIAATKNYVDNAGFASVANLYVATSGSDERIGVGSSTQGRALPFAYRTLEAALKKAEEIIKSSPPEIGPYRKVLTWTNPDNGVINNCTLTDIAVSPDNGAGFAGRVTLTIDTIRLVFGGYNFKVNEILRINKVGGAAIDAATVRILTVASEPGAPNGPILTFQLLTGGKFDLDLPVTNAGGNTSVTATDSGNINFEINNSTVAQITNASILDISASHSLQLPTYTVAQATGLANVATGQVIYVSNGAGGSPCLAVYSGGWKQVAIGNTITT
jgi:hypothetical protein